MSYIGNKPLTQAEKKTQQHTTTASKTVYPVSGGYSVGLIDVFLNGVLLLDNVDYSATDGLNVNLFIATTNDDTLVTVAWGAFVVADVVQPNDVRLATAWGLVDGENNSVVSGFNVASVIKQTTGVYRVTFTTPMDNADYTAVANSRNTSLRISTFNEAVGYFDLFTNISTNASTDNVIPMSFHVFGGKN